MAAPKVSANLLLSASNKKGGLMLHIKYIIPAKRVDFQYLPDLLPLIYIKVEEYIDTNKSQSVWSNIKYNRDNLHNIKGVIWNYYNDIYAVSKPTTLSQQ